MTISVAQKSAEAFRTISEVADALKLPQHVLRFWETRFAQIKPMKRAGGRRFYRPEDIELLGAIRQLLYGEGYTIKGVQRILREQGPRAVAVLARQHGRPQTFEPLSEAEAAQTPFEGDAEEEVEGRPVPGVVPADLSVDRLPGEVAGERSDDASGDPIERLRAVLAEIDACRDLLRSIGG